MLTQKRIPWNKGLTKETHPSLKKMSETKIKRHHTVWNKGLTKETDERVRKYGETNKRNGGNSKFLKEVFWTKERKTAYGLLIKKKWQTEEFKDKTNTNRNSVMKTEEYHNHLSEAQINRLKNPELLQEFLNRMEKARQQPNYGKNISQGLVRALSFPEQRKKKSLIAKLLWSQDWFVKKVRKYKQTKIEQIMDKVLKKNSLVFKTNIPIKLSGFVTIPDHVNFIYKIAIYDDGDYWHNYPEGKSKDKIEKEQLEKLGWKVFRFWEHEILEDPEKCVNTVKSFLFASASTPSKQAALVQSPPQENH